ncbi:cytochrome c [Mucilaginibacter sp. SG564]|uniref:c-type cytochrome n=1 Tax=Mucilaginibacter sp. SG564 TaxID=2587022 RepID=UPI0015520144|nr:cytochrome c [Mucilaginibacter sp. SG564]NOW93528.1 mono/diheme cytochrome c family protein [Mucilaginibacter sp. SG564]
MKKPILVIACLFCCAPLLAQIKTKAKPKPAARLAAVDGKGIYEKYCLTCHQGDGGGVPNMNPPLIKTSYVLGDKTRLIKVVLNGFSENVDIDGESYSNVMPSHDFLKDQEIAAVLTYVRKNFTNKAGPITTAQVKAVRATNKKKI